MDFRAKHKYARCTARKARLVVDMVRGKSVNEALETLEFSHRRPSVMVEKIIRSAMSNANSYVEKVRNDPESHPHVDFDVDSFDVEDLYVKDAFVDAGPTIKRWLPRAMGRATPLNKRTCHITITLGME